MKKILAIEFPKALYDNFENLRNDDTIIELDGHYYVSYCVKTMTKFNFTNEFIEQEYEENLKLTNNPTDENILEFLGTKFPNIIDIWNKYNANKLKELQKDNTSEEDIEKYWAENNLTFANEVIFKIYYI